MKKDIIEKLNKHIVTGINREADAFYLMGEIRKILEQEGVYKTKTLYPTLKFYCDWILHTKKDKITPEIEQIINRIDKEISLDQDRDILRGHPENISFIYMEELKKELSSFLSDFGLSNNFISDLENWLSFIQLIIDILIDQPIINPISSINSFSFQPANKGCVIWIIDFNDSRGQKKFGNAY